MGQGYSRKLKTNFYRWFKGKWGKATGVVLLAFLLLFLITPLPDPLFQDPYATTLRDRDGLLLSAAIASDYQWRFPPSDSIPKKFKVAIRLFEDEYFQYHPGINPISIIRAIRQNFREGKIVSGGSTLSMQTVRMAFGNQSRTYGQKILEIFSTIKMELIYSKREILQTYTDHAPFGGNIVGINAASWRYFGRPPHQLSWSETATLAILPNNPGSIFPGKNQKLLLAKRNRLLDKIFDRGYLSTDELFLSKEEKLPHHIRELPDMAYHLLHRSMSEGLEGTNVISTLDGRLQNNASRIVNQHSRHMSENQIQNAAAVILDLKSGNTLAYVGNTKNPGDHGQHVDVITAPRSPGSLLKPFLYASAMDEGLIYPRQLLPDIPVFYKGFAPKNFDKEYRGAVPANEALTSSLNVPFVHLLIEYGYEKFHQKLQQIGFDKFNQPATHYGLSMILGGAETSLWEITSVYAGFARVYQNFLERPIGRGYSRSDFHPNQYINQINGDDKFLETDGLIRASSIGFALEAMQQLQRPDEENGWEVFNSTKPIAWKTGTSFGFRDGWAIGLNDQYLIGVWIGNADGEGRPGLTGIKAAAPLLFELFDLVGGQSIIEESFGTSVPICTESGMRANNNCINSYPMSLPEYMNLESSCQYHIKINLNESEQYQVNSSCYPVAKMKQVSWFVLPPIQSWYYQKYHPNYEKLPEYISECDMKNASRLFDLIYPRRFAKVHIPVEQDGKFGNAVFEATHENADALLFWHLDDEYLGSTQRNHQMGIRTTKGIHTITIIDESGDEISQQFEVVN